MQATLNTPETEDSQDIPVAEAGCTFQFDLSYLDSVDTDDIVPISRNVEISREHFGYFCRYFLRHHFTKDFGDFHIELQTQLQNLRPGRHALFLLPREHGKSTLFNFAFILWNICYRRRRHIGIVSTTATNAEKFLNKIQVELQNNDRLRAGFGDLVGTDQVGRKEKWRTNYIKTTNQVIVFTAGVGGSVRGTNESLPEDLARDFVGRDRFGRPLYRNLKSYRPDLIIFDDVIEDKQVKTLHVRDKLSNWFWSAAYNTPETGVGNIIIVGTTVHDDDMVMRLWKDKIRTVTWLKVRMPACKGFDKSMNPIKALWPEKWIAPDINRPVDRTGRPYTDEELQITDKSEIFYLSHLTWKKIDLGTVIFAKEFLLEPLDDSQRYFKRDWFRYWINESVIFTPAQQEHMMMSGINYDVLPDDLIVVTSVDPAGSRGKSAEMADRDYTAIVTQGYSPGQRRYYLIDVDRVRASFATVMQLMFKHFVAYSNRFGGDFWPSGQIGVGEVIKDAAKPWEHMGFIVESVAYQKVLADTINELSIAFGMYAPVIEVKRGQRDKTARALIVSPIVERGQWYAPLTSHVELINTSIDACLDEMAIFPQGAHDDCFPAETLIVTRRGEVPICEVVAGDYVWTRFGWRRVLKAWVTGVKKVITKFGITSTPTHRIWTENREWVKLADLKIDDTIFTYQKGSAVLNATSLGMAEHEWPILDARTCKTWNLHIDEHHEYIANGVLVANCVDGVVDGLTFLQKLSLNLNRGLSAQLAMKDLLKRNPTMYAAVQQDIQNTGTDMQSAMQNYGAAHPQPGYLAQNL